MEMENKNMYLKKWEERIEKDGAINGKVEEGKQLIIEMLTLQTGVGPTALTYSRPSHAHL